MERYYIGARIGDTWNVGTNGNHAVIGTFTIHEHDDQNGPGLPGFTWSAATADGASLGYWHSLVDAAAEVILRHDPAADTEEVRRMVARIYGVYMPAGYPSHEHARVTDAAPVDSYEIVCCGNPITVSPVPVRCPSCGDTLVVTPKVMTRDEAGELALKLSSGVAKIASYISATAYAEGIADMGYEISGVQLDAINTSNGHPTWLTGTEVSW